MVKRQTAEATLGKVRITTKCPRMFTRVSIWVADVNVSTSGIHFTVPTVDGYSTLSQYEVQAISASMFRTDPLMRGLEPIIMSHI